MHVGSISRTSLVIGVKSSLVLQMSLFFNITFFPVWFIIIVASFVTKVSSCSLHKSMRFHHFLSPCMVSQYECLGWFAYVMLGCGLTTLVVVEATRLYLGVSGNLGEHTAELSTFWFTTLVLQLPLMIVTFIIALSLRHILEAIALCVSTLMIAVQLSVTFQVLRNVTRHQQQQLSFWK